MVTGHAISGLTIVNLATGESHVSAATAVSFSTPSGVTPALCVVPGTGVDTVTLGAYTGGAIAIYSSTGDVDISSRILLEGDAFIDTAGTLLTAHTPSLGGAAWVVSSGSSPTIRPSGYIEHPANTAGIMKANGVTPNADQAITMAFLVASQIGNLGPTGRNTGNFSFLVFINYDCPSDTALLAYRNGAGSIVAGSAVLGATPGYHTLRLKLQGAFASVEFDGVQVIAPAAIPVLAGDNAGLLASSAIVAGTTTQPALWTVENL